MTSKLEMSVKWTDLKKQHFVFYADIMGFKNLVATKSHADMQRDMVNFFNYVDTQSQPLVGPKMRMMRFSDSILLITEDVTKSDLNRLTKAAIRLMQLGLRMKLPLRGAIAQGVLTVDEEKQLVFGQALVDAYLLEEELLYYGVAVHHSAEDAIVRNLATQPYHLLELPMKSGSIPHYQLSWHRFNFSLEKEDVTNKIMKDLDKVQAEVSCRPRIYINNTRKMIAEVNGIIKRQTNED